ncbi:hypothetical protein ACFL1H_04520 [Nanoarchaeota archaeon]
MNQMNYLELEIRNYSSTEEYLLRGVGSSGAKFYNPQRWLVTAVLISHSIFKKVIKYEES